MACGTELVTARVSAVCPASPWPRVTDASPEGVGTRPPASELWLCLPPAPESQPRPAARLGLARLSLRLWCPQKPDVSVWTLAEGGAGGSPTGGAGSASPHSGASLRLSRAGSARAEGGRQAPGLGGPGQPRPTAAATCGPWRAAPETARGPENHEESVGSLANDLNSVTRKERE